MGQRQETYIIETQYGSLYQIRFQFDGRTIIGATLLVKLGTETLPFNVQSITITPTSKTQYSMANKVEGLLDKCIRGKLKNQTITTQKITCIYNTKYGLPYSP